MKLKFERRKRRKILFSIIYRLNKFPFTNRNKKLKLYLNLNWIFWRLAIEQADKNFSFSEESMRTKNLQFLIKKLSRDHKVLDLGCKYGRISSLIAEKTKVTVGVDYDKVAIDIAKKENSKNNLSFYHEDAYNYLTNSDESFDVIVLSHILEHLDGPEEFLTKFKCFFTYFYIEIPDFDDSYLNMYRYKTGARLIYTDDDHIWEFDRDSFQELLIKCDLDIIDSEYRYGLQKYWCKNTLSNKK